MTTKMLTAAKDNDFENFHFLSQAGYDIGFCLTKDSPDGLSTSLVLGIKENNYRIVEAHTQSVLESKFFLKLFLEGLKKGVLIVYTSNFNVNDVLTFVSTKFQLPNMRSADIDPIFQDEAQKFYRGYNSKLFLDHILGRSLFLKASNVYSNKLNKNLLAFQNVIVIDLQSTIKVNFLSADESNNYHVDGWCWSPSTITRFSQVLEKSIVFELDGYEYHSSKEMFTSDRKRDRNLSNTFKVFRFSGLEIYHDLQSTTEEALEILISQL